MENNSLEAEKIKIPRNMHLNEDVDRMEFEYNSFKFKYVTTILLAPVFAYFLIDSDYVPGSVSNLQIPGWIVILCCVLVMYYALVKIINTTRISVSKDRIKVKSGPLIIFKNLYLFKEDVSQLYVTKHSIGHRYYLQMTTYQVNVILRNKKVITLVKGLTSADQGRFIEQKIESFLEITDIPVEGEIEKH
jgi:hypothetical protein